MKPISFVIIFIILSSVTFALSVSHSQLNGSMSIISKTTGLPLATIGSDSGYGILSDNLPIFGKGILSTNGIQVTSGDISASNGNLAVGGNAVITGTSQFLGGIQIPSNGALNIQTGGEVYIKTNTFTCDAGDTTLGYKIDEKTCKSSASALQCPKVDTNCTVKAVDWQTTIPSSDFNCKYNSYFSASTCPPGKRICIPPPSGCLPSVCTSNYYVKCQKPIVTKMSIDNLGNLRANLLSSDLSGLTDNRLVCANKDGSLAICNGPTTTIVASPGITVGAWSWCQAGRAADPTTISWSVSENNAICIASGAWTGTLKNGNIDPNSGSQTLRPTINSTYSISCSVNGLTTTKSVSVIVKQWVAIPKTLSGTYGQSVNELIELHGYTSYINAGLLFSTDGGSCGYYVWNYGYYVNSDGESYRYTVPTFKDANYYPIVYYGPGTDYMTRTAR